MYCPNCKKEIPDGAKFCRFCGASVAEISFFTDEAGEKADFFNEIEHRFELRPDGEMPKSEKRKTSSVMRIVLIFGKRQT